MHVDGVALARTLVAEKLDPLDELHDPIGLVANQLGQQALVIGNRRFQQLRRAANARKRVLDLMREHGAECGDRPRCPSMGQLSVHFFGNCPFLQHNHHGIALAGQRRGENIDDPIDPEPGRAEVEPVLADAGAAPLHLLDQREHGRAEGDQIVDTLPLQDDGAGLEEVLGGGVGVEDAMILADDDDRHGQDVERLHLDRIEQVVIPALSAPLGECHRHTAIPSVQAAARP